MDDLRPMDPERAARRLRQLDQVLKRTSECVGIECLSCMAEALSLSLGVRAAFAAQVVPGAGERLRLRALWQDGAPAQLFDYDAAGTPCHRVLQERSPVVLEAPCDQFPADRWLADLDAKLYVAVPVLDEDGAVEAHLGIVHDAPLEHLDDVVALLSAFAPRARAEMRRHALEVELRAEAAFRAGVIARANEGVCVCHEVAELPFVCFTVWNDRMTELTGYDMATINQRGWYQSLYPDTERREAAIARMARMREGDDLIAEEWLITRADGSARRVEISTSVLTGHGEAPQVLAMLQDVTERNRRLDELQRLNEFHQSLIDAMSEGVAVFDGDERWAFVNRAGAEMLGYRPEDLIGRLGVETVIDTDVPVMAHANERRARGVADRYPLTLRHRDGHPVPAMVSAVPRTVDGEYAGSLSVFTDLSALHATEAERSELEAQLRRAQKLESLGTLAGGIAHDFNNILAIVSASAELGLDALEQGEPVEEDLREIQTAVRRARDLVRQILAFSSRAEEELRPVRFPPLIDETLKLLRQALPSSVEIRAKLQRDVPPVLGTPSYLQQVLLNLCTNAAHAMRDIPGRLDVELFVDTDGAQALAAAGSDGATVVLRVGDTGTGMPPEVLERVFEPYFTTKPKGEGTGLGLAVVHGIVRTLGGVIDVESKSGTGTTFTVRFPACAERRLSVPPPSRDLPRGRGQRVLCVDDEPTIAEAHRRIADSLGYRAEAVTDPSRALERLREAPDGFDLVFTDQSMPGMTGVALSEALRRVRPDLPVVVCTGNYGWIDGARARAAGVVTVIDKPARKEDIAFAFELALRKRQE
jgi:PAS domain S-box-containing protein